MDQIADFITKHQFMIAVFLIFIVIMLVGHYSPLNKKLEGMENLKQYSNRDMYLKHSSSEDIELPDGTMTKSSRVQYLSIVPKSQCNGIDENQLLDCLYNMAILNDKPDKFSRLTLSHIPFSKPTRYTLRSTIKQVDDNDTEGINRHHMSQNVNLKGGDKLCFDDGYDDIIQFEIEDVGNKKYKLKFRKSDVNSDNSDSETTYIYYYISKCDGSNSVCGSGNGDSNGDDKFNRLCVYDDPDKAIIFTLHLIEKEKKSKPVREKVVSKVNDDVSMTTNAASTTNADDITNPLIFDDSSGDNGRNEKEDNENNEKIDMLESYLDNLDLYSLAPSMMSSGSNESMDNGNNGSQNSDSLEGFDQFAETTGGVNFGDEFN
jgi:hypothetical protein